MGFVALGRKNYFFAGFAGGERAAATFTLIGATRLNGPGPGAYQREVLTRTADHPEDESMSWRVVSAPVDVIKDAA